MNEFDEHYCAGAFPADLLHSLPISNEPRTWWLAHAISQSALIKELQEFKIPHYSPSCTQNIIHRGKLATAMAPLFPGLVFVYCNDDERVRALTTNLIDELTPVGDQGQLLHDLRQLHRVLNTNARMKVEENVYQTGRRVRVKRGALAGLEGQIIEQRNEYRLAITVLFLNRGVTVDIDNIDVELLEENEAPLSATTVDEVSLGDTPANVELKLLVDPGIATPEELSEFYVELSRLDKMLGGAGIQFNVIDCREPVVSEDMP